LSLRRRTTLDIEAAALNAVKVLGRDGRTACAVASDPIHRAQGQLRVLIDPRPPS
jgi:hypothetical protein